MPHTQLFVDNYRYKHVDWRGSSCQTGNISRSLMCKFRKQQKLSFPNSIMKQNSTKSSMVQVKIQRYVINCLVLVGLPKLHYYATEGDFNVMVIDLLGPCLEDLLEYCRRKFTLKTVVMLAIQMVFEITNLNHYVALTNRICASKRFPPQRYQARQFLDWLWKELAHFVSHRFRLSKAIQGSKDRPPYPVQG